MYTSNPFCLDEWYVVSISIAIKHDQPTDVIGRMLLPGKDMASKMAAQFCLKRDQQLRNKYLFPTL